MRQVKRWRYYCDFCKKAKMQKAAMVKHETGCTKNPQRKCGICELSQEEQHPIPVLIEALQRGFPDLRAISNNCPVCILAAIRQHNDAVEGWEEIHPEFDFKAEMQTFWDAYNNDHGARY